MWEVKPPFLPVLFFLFSFFSDGVAQSVGPEFKPQYCKKTISMIIQMRIFSFL
jgi:hypothetical protein